MKIARLEISDSVLKFCIGENNWCQVQLDTGSQVYKLGAENWEVLKGKITKSFGLLSESSEPEWMLTLAEEHCSLYKSRVDGMNQFVWFDAQAEKIWESGLIAPIDESELQFNK